MPQAKQRLTDLGIDTEKLTIGFMSEKKLQRGHQIISDLQSLLLAGNPTRVKSQTVKLTNDFYQLIPHNFGLKVPPLLDHLVRLKEKTRMLEVLRDFDAMQQMMVEAFSKKSFSQVNYYDMLFQQLKVFLGKLDRGHDADLFQLLESSVMNTVSEQHNVDVLVRDIYSVSKPMHDVRFRTFDKKLHNKCMLFQGVTQTSLASTLRDGIKYPMEQAAHVAFMFGKGLYFTDCFSKAAL